MPTIMLFLAPTPVSGSGDPTNGYLLEDGSFFYLLEDGSNFYVQET